MYTVTTRSEFDAAHFLAGYDGKCRNIHGHRWEVVVRVSKDSLEEHGMVVDFKDLKKDLRDMTEYFDHSLIMERDTLKPTTMAALREEDFRIVEMDFRPTAENLAKYFYGEMKRKGYAVSSALVYETPTNCAEYCEE